MSKRSIATSGATPGAPDHPLPGGGMPVPGVDPPQPVLTSGDPTPSRADAEMTQEVKVAAILSIALHDHVIIGNGRHHLSFRREGLL